MKIFEIIRVLAAAPAVQILFLEPIPENLVVDESAKKNNVYRMMVLYRKTINVIDDIDSGGCEGIDTWFERSGVTAEMHADRNHPLWKTSPYLNTVLRLISAEDRDFNYTKHGLRSAHEWKLVRKLASEVLSACGEDQDLSYGSFEDLWVDAYGNYEEDDDLGH
ncbi:MAG: hypothetical protein QM496_03830 [Verrucomicrobiota bacterium]